MKLLSKMIESRRQFSKVFTELKATTKTLDDLDFSVLKILFKIELKTKYVFDI